MKKLFFGSWLVASSVLLLSDIASAQSEGVIDTKDPQVILDNVFVFICAVLVIFMQAGFAFLEAGLNRAKNAAHIMLKNLLDIALGTAAFAIVGYHIGFSGADYLGFTWQWAGPDNLAAYSETLSIPVHFVFQAAFAAASATIVSGALAERVQFKGYIVYGAFLAGLMYPVVVGWVWNDQGWLAELGFVDFAGGTVVHTVGGTAALVGAIILGPRIGRFDEDGQSAPIPGHNIPITVIGVFILFFGWFGFNAGSLLEANVQVGSIAAVTLLSASAGGLGGLSASWLTIRTPDVTLIGNGLLGGLVSVTAGALYFSPFGALIVGFIGGIVATNGALLLDRLRIDDPVSAVPVHLFAGIWGTLAVGFFADPDAVIGGTGPAGLLYGGASLIVTQLVGILVILGFVSLSSIALFTVLREIRWLRVSPENEMVGLDLAEHATPAYNDDFVEYDDDIITEDAFDDWFGDELVG